jgi:putative hydrolase of the HAD superfamily
MQPEGNMCAVGTSPETTVRAVLLDLDDTLIVEEAHARAQLRATAGVAGVDPDVWEALVLEIARSEWHASEHYPACRDLGIASWEGLWATFDGAHPLIAPLRGFVGTYRTTTWSRALERAGKNPELGPELSRIYVEGQRSGHPLAPGAADLVRRAVSIGPVAVVTNGPPDIQRLKLEQTGLAGNFSAVLISGELGSGKPDPDIFLHALEALGVEAQAAVMVGDSWERDIEGALSVGMRAVWISHGREPPRVDTRVSVADGPGTVTFATDD